MVKNALTAGALSQTPLQELTVLPSPRTRLRGGVKEGKIEEERVEKR